MAFEFNNPLVMQLRAGTISDPYVDKSDLRVIINNQITLDEIPDQFNHVSIGGYTEVFKLEELTSSNFYVNYLNGCVTFLSSEESKTVTAVYKGRGIIQYPGERVYIPDINGGNVSTAIQNIINTELSTLETINTLTGNISSISQSMATLVSGQLTIDTTAKTITTLAGSLYAISNKIKTLTGGTLSYSGLDGTVFYVYVNEANIYVSLQGYETSGTTYLLGVIRSNRFYALDARNIQVDGNWNGGEKNSTQIVAEASLEAVVARSGELSLDARLSKIENGDRNSAINPVLISGQITIDTVAKTAVVLAGSMYSLNKAVVVLNTQTINYSAIIGTVFYVYVKGAVIIISGQSYTVDKDTHLLGVIRNERFYALDTRNIIVNNKWNGGERNADQIITEAEAETITARSTETSLDARLSKIETGVRNVAIVATLLSGRFTVNSIAKTLVVLDGSMYSLNKSVVVLPAQTIDYSAIEGSVFYVYVKNTTVIVSGQNYVSLDKDTHFMGVIRSGRFYGLDTRNILVDNKWNGGEKSAEQIVALSIVGAKALTSTIVTVGQSGGVDFSNIQDAIDSIVDDSAIKPYVIAVMPGIYPRFTLMYKPGALRYVSIIGIDKKSCIVKDDSGNYLTPPANINTNGDIKKLTFIATHDVPVWESDTRKAYAIHCDFNTEQLNIEDCILISYQAPAIGIGLHPNETITLKNCELYSYATADYGNLVNHGALFCHAAELANTLNQKLIVDNCKLYHANSFGLRVQDSLLENSKVTFTITRTGVYSGVLGKDCIYTNGTTDVVPTPDSFGNSHVSLNP